MSDIFISYASADQARAKIFAEAFIQHGWSVWWDRKIPPGKTFAQVIKEAIDDTKCIVVLWSNNSVKSDWAQNEASEGLKRKILVPALIDDVEIPFEFKRIQAAQLVKWSGILTNPEFKELISSIQTIIEYSKSISIEKPIEPKNEEQYKLQEQVEQVLPQNKKIIIGNVSSEQTIIKSQISEKRFKLNYRVRLKVAFLGLIVGEILAIFYYILTSYKDIFLGYLFFGISGVIAGFIIGNNRKVFYISIIGVLVTFIFLCILYGLADWGDSLSISWVFGLIPYAILGNIIFRWKNILESIKKIFRWFVT